MSAFRVRHCLADVDTSQLGQHNDDPDLHRNPSTSGSSTSPNILKDKQRHVTNVPSSLLLAADSEAVKMDWVHAISLMARTLRECFQPRHTGPVTHIFGSAATFPVVLPPTGTWGKPRKLNTGDLAQRWPFKVSVFSCFATEFLNAGGIIEAPEDLHQAFQAKRKAQLKIRQQRASLHQGEKPLIAAAVAAASLDSSNPFGAEGESEDEDVADNGSVTHPFVKEVEVTWTFEKTLTAWHTPEQPSQNSSEHHHSGQLELCALAPQERVNSASPSRSGGTVEHLDGWHAIQCFVMGLDHSKVYRFAAHSCEVAPPPAEKLFIADHWTPPFRFVILCLAFCRELCGGIQCSLLRARVETEVRFGFCLELWFLPPPQGKLVCHAPHWQFFRTAGACA